jgi:alpha-L-arabinofuranosidase
VFHAVLSWQVPNFGTFEFFTTCERLGTAPMFTVNLSNGTAEEAAALVAFTTGTQGDTRSIGTDSNGIDWKTVDYWATIRTELGHPAPFNALLFELGNELWADADAGAWLLRVVKSQDS